MSEAKASFQLAEHIARGLANGTYERIGGVIRNVVTKEPLVWLREALKVTQPLLPDLLSPSTAGILNLAISTMGFAIVMKRLSDIERQLREAQATLFAINEKIDVSFYANFHAALNLATNAFTMSSTDTRRVSASQAINRFLEAEHHYTNLAETQTNLGSKVASEYLSTLCLAYVTEARCYLELEEIQTARRRLKEGFAAFRERLLHHVGMLLTSNPAAYLHPMLKSQITLKRLTKVFQWINPGIDESALFELQRENIFRLEQHYAEWFNSLPQAIRMPHSSVLATQQKTHWAARTPLKTGIGGLLNNFRAAAPVPPVYLSLPGTLQLIETLIEDERRFAMYLLEIEALLKLNISFQDWQQLVPPPDSQNGAQSIIYITLS